MISCDVKRSLLEESAEVRLMRNTLYKNCVLLDAHAIMDEWWHLGAGMQTIIIKSNRLRDSPFADIIWMGFNNAVRDAFSRLSLPRRMYPWTLRLMRGQGRFGEPADAIPRFGERHPAMHRATFTTSEHRCFVFAFYWLPVRGTTLSLFFTALPLSFFYSMKRLDIAKKNYSVSSLFTHIYTHIHIYFFFLRY